MRLRYSDSSMNHSAEYSEFWIPYSDIMAGLLGVFALLLISTLHSLGEKNSDIKDILEERKQVVHCLTEAFQDDPRVSVNPETGAINFAGDVLFDVDRWDLKPEGGAILSEVMPTYLRVLFSNVLVLRNLNRVEIVGHADRSFNESRYMRTNEVFDPEIAYKYNLQLSQKRALSVMQYLLDDPALEVFREQLKEFSTANGRSFMDPKYLENGELDYDKSRRIEIEFTLLDNELLEEVFRRLYPKSR